MTTLQRFVRACSGTSQRPDDFVTAKSFPDNGFRAMDLAASDLP